MGPQRQRLAILAQLIVLCAVPAAARAEESKQENKQALARSLFNFGIGEYKAKDYEAATASLAKSQSLDPRPETLYALAQAERLANQCKEALVHYEQLLETLKDEKVLQRVRENIDLCKQIEAGKPAPVEQKKEDIVQRDAPTIEYRTIVRTERKRDVLSVVLFVGGGIAVSGGAAGYLISRSLAKDADHAQSIEEYNRKYDQSRQLRWGSYAAGGVGAILFTVALIRVIGGGKSETRRVAVAPIRGGSVVSWSGHW
jgi:tetratricopeptide (TPR) repeat protein